MDIDTPLRELGPIDAVAHILRLLASVYLGKGNGALFRKRRITFSVNRDTLFL